jgi:hypothetical protein
LVLVGVLAACGSSNKVEGDLSFDVKSARALVQDAGAGLPVVVDVVMMDKDVSCDDLKAFIQKSENPDPNSHTPVFPPFSQAVSIGFPGTSAATHTIIKPQPISFTGLPDGGLSTTRVPSGDAAVAEVSGGGILGDVAVSGTVNVTGVSGSATGSFDTQAIDLYAYLEFELNSDSQTDSSGNPLYPDAGAIPQKQLKGEFEADVCP